MHGLIRHHKLEDGPGVVERDDALNLGHTGVRIWKLELLNELNELCVTSSESVNSPQSKEEMHHQLLMEETSVQEAHQADETRLQRVCRHRIRQGRDMAKDIPKLFDADGNFLWEDERLPPARVMMASLWMAMGKMLDATSTFLHITARHLSYRTITSNMKGAKQIYSMKFESPDCSELVGECHSAVDSTSCPSSCVTRMNFYKQCQNIARALKLTDAKDWMDLAKLFNHTELDAMQGIDGFREVLLLVWERIEGDLEVKSKILYGALAYCFPKEVRHSNIRDEHRPKGHPLDYWNVDELGKPTNMFAEDYVTLKASFMRYYKEVEEKGWTSLCAVVQECESDNFLALRARLDILWLQALPKIHDFCRTKKRTRDLMENRQKANRFTKRVSRASNDEPSKSVKIVSLSHDLLPELNGRTVVLEPKEDGSYQIDEGMLFW